MMSNGGLAELGADKIIHGIPLNTGIGIGHFRWWNIINKVRTPRPITVSQVQQQKESFVKARTRLVNDLDELAGNLAEEAAEIIESQKHIVMDPEIEREIFRVVENDLLGIDFAIYTTFEGYIGRLKENGDELFRQRIIDLQNLRNRLVNLVTEKEYNAQKIKNAIVVADELSPVRLIEMYKNGLKGIVLGNAGITSHAVIIAKSLGIPCIISPDDLPPDGAGTVILDSNKGMLILNPAKETLAEYKTKISEEKKRKKRLIKDAAGISETKSGTRFSLTANLEFLSEFDQLKALNITDIGLLRTEWMFLEGKTGEKEQQQFYAKVLKAVSGTVVIRLFDLGGDKLKDDAEKEMNPFLGLRGIRLLLEHADILRTQLRAILKTTVKNRGRIKILVPMITTEEEITKVKSRIGEVENELIAEGYKIETNVPVGIMIEVPAIALIADRIAGKVDFFSIGTNDLTQYAMAVDRGNSRISELYQHYHPAVWQLIKLTVQAAHAGNIPVTVCGELAGEIPGACGLMGLGVRDLSMAPSTIPRVNEVLSTCHDEDFEKLAQTMLSASSAKQALDYFETWQNSTLR